MKPSNNPKNKIPSDTWRLKSSANIKSSGSQTFKTTTWIQSRQDAFNKSRLGTTFLTNLGVTEMLCSSRIENK